MSDLDAFKRRKQELRASGMGAVMAHQTAMDEARQQIHDREQAVLDQPEQTPRSTP